MTRADLARDLLVLEQVAKRAYARAAVLREQLEREARGEYEQHGSAPTWRFPDVGQVALPLSQEKVAVGDEHALIAWVVDREPDLVAQVWQLRPGAVEALLEVVDHDGQTVFVADTKEPVPGLVVRPGGLPGSLRFTPDRDAKKLVGMVAEQILTVVAEQLGVRPIESTVDGEV